MKRTALLVMLLLGAAGCPPALPPEPIETQLPALEPAEVVARVVARRQVVHAVRARVETAVSFEGNEFETEMALLLERPDRMRAEVLGLFGPLLLMALDGDRLTAFDAARDHYVSGSYPAGAMRAQLPLPPLASDELLNLLLGTPLDAQRAARLQVRESDVRSRLRFTWSEPTGQGEVVMHDTLAVPLSLEWRGRRGGPGYRARWAWRDGDDLPRRVEIVFGDGRASLVVRWDEVERDPTLDDALFTVPQPPGVEHLDLDRPGPRPGSRRR